MKVKTAKLFLCAALALLLPGCAEVQYASYLAKKGIGAEEKGPKTEGTFKVGKPYAVGGRVYYPQENYDLVETGIASWYGSEFQGKKTANGERFDMNELTAAHRTLQMPSLARVTNLGNGRSVIVRINDRGPYKRGRVMDVSAKAADLLGFKNVGTAKVRIEVLKQESLQIASAAKRGMNTRGFELALNQPGRAETGMLQMPVAQPYEVASAGPFPAVGESVPPVQPVSREILSTPSPVPGDSYRSIVPGHLKDGEFYPEPVVTEFPVSPSHIYVQTGSFSVYENAARQSQVLARFAESKVFPALVGGRQFYRVRLGPVASVENADALLAQVVTAGNNDAIIIVE